MKEFVAKGLDGEGFVRKLLSSVTDPWSGWIIGGFVTIWI